MKIILSTTPIRPVPTDYPPFGSLALIQALRTAGYDPYFYDIDGLRPSFDDVIRFYRDQKPDLIAISAVVSTAYGYTKKLCLKLKSILPDTPIILGGNLAASAELLHRFCKVDICAIGEGERVIVNLVKYLQQNGGKLNPETLRSIPGISFLNAQGEMAFTGYEVPLTVDEFADPDFSILDQYSKISNFVVEPLDRPDFARDPRSYQPHRKGQRLSTVVSSKGCVARCTFCHRWDKGYRPLKPETMVKRIQYLRDRYNVGFFNFTDENFGSDAKNLEDLITLIKPLDILFQVGGVRCRSVNPDRLRRLREAGCTGLYYGMETGSPRILKVMEKNASLEDNINAALWTHEAGLYTIFQLVLAMPGENNETINETLDFVKKVTGNLPEAPHRSLSINYIQALPGTAVYEYAREKGMIGKSLADEDRYLNSISDLDASDDMKFLNFTEEDYFTVQSWRHQILFEASRHWYKLHDWKPSTYVLPSGKSPEMQDYYTQGGYFNLKKMIHRPFFYRYFFPFRKIYSLSYVIVKDLLRPSSSHVWTYLLDYFKTRLKKRPALANYQSLRGVVKELGTAPTSVSQQSMMPLRQGR